MSLSFILLFFTANNSTQALWTVYSKLHSQTTTELYVNLLMHHIHCSIQLISFVYLCQHVGPMCLNKATDTNEDHYNSLNCILSSLTKHDILKTQGK